MKIANTITFLTGSWQNQQILVRPYKLTYGGARRILQVECDQRNLEADLPKTTVSVERISYMTYAN